KKEGEKGETILYSLTANAIIPAKSLSEMGVALTGFMARMQANRQGDGGGIPLEELEEAEEEAPDEGNAEEQEDKKAEQPPPQTF
ncbi:MAG: hypothetical protein N3A66_04825, partial [Planctomycetota bacterium]|nr:hypothetical protein [Planctomycetota bacterium]